LGNRYLKFNTNLLLKGVKMATPKGYLDPANPNDQIGILKRAYDVGDERAGAILGTWAEKNPSYQPTEEEIRAISARSGVSLER